MHNRRYSEIPIYNMYTWSPFRIVVAAKSPRTWVRGSIETKAEVWRPEPPFLSTKSQSARSLVLRERTSHAGGALLKKLNIPQAGMGPRKGNFFRGRL